MKHKRAIAAVFAASIAVGLYGCDRVPEEMDDEPAAPTAQYDETDVEQAEEEQAEQADRAEDDEAGPVTLIAAEAEGVGDYVADSDGRSLYLFEADSPGESTCHDACAEAWPPLLVEEGEYSAGAEIDGDKMDTLERRDGRHQMTYDGWPLYYFERDQEPGDIEGQDVEGFGAEWYLISPEGEKIHAEGEGS